jgi:hypothetical protein
MTVQPEVESVRSPFDAWFLGTWKQADETKTRALARLEGQTGLALMTLRRALRGQPVRRESALALSRITSGVVTAAQLSGVADAPASSPGAVVAPSSPAETQAA